MDEFAYDTEGAPIETVGAVLSSVNEVETLLAAAKFPALSDAVPAGTVKAIVPLPVPVMVTVTVLPDGVPKVMVLIPAVPVRVVLFNTCSGVSVIEPVLKLTSL